MNKYTDEYLGIYKREGGDPVLSESDYDQFRTPFRYYQRDSNCKDKHIKHFSAGWLARGEAVMSWNSSEEVGKIDCPDDLAIGESWTGPFTTAGTKVIMPEQRTKTKHGCTFNMIGVLVEVHEGVHDRIGTAKMIADALNHYSGYPKRGFKNED